MSTVNKKIADEITAIISKPDVFKYEEEITLTCDLIRSLRSSMFRYSKIPSIS